MGVSELEICLERRKPNRCRCYTDNGVPGGTDVREIEDVKIDVAPYERLICVETPAPDLVAEHQRLPGICRFKAALGTSVLGAKGTSENPYPEHVEEFWRGEKPS